MGTNTTSYVFDPIGNRITATNNADVTSYAANALNQYTDITNAIAAQPIHDDDGNMTFLPSTSRGEGLSFVWDGENRLRSVLSNDILLVTYTYDHRSRRIGKTASGTTQSFLYDGWNLIAETIHHSSFTTHNSYVWGLDLSGSLQGAGGVGGLPAVVKDSNTYHPAWDANGNVCDYSSTDGTLAAHYEYSPFGETVLQSGDLAESFVFRFSTKYWENESKLYYYGYRFYVPESGRWLNRDPIGEKGDLGLFCAMINDSINHLDLLGLKNGLVKWGCDQAFRFTIWIFTMFYGTGGDGGNGPDTSSTMPGQEETPIEIVYVVIPANPPSNTVEIASATITISSSSCSATPPDQGGTMLDTFIASFLLFGGNRYLHMLDPLPDVIGYIIETSSEVNCVKGGACCPAPIISPVLIPLLL